MTWYPHCLAALPDPLKSHMWLKAILLVEPLPETTPFCRFVGDTKAEESDKIPAPSPTGRELNICRFRN